MKTLKEYLEKYLEIEKRGKILQEKMTAERVTPMGNVIGEKNRGDYREQRNEYFEGEKILNTIIDEAMKNLKISLDEFMDGLDDLEK